MLFFLTYPANALLGLFVAGYAAVTGMKSVTRSLLSPSEGSMIRTPSPYIELDVKPVSEGDEVILASCRNGKYKASIANRRKKAMLEIEAGTRQELERKVQDTFRAWAIVGRKKKDWPYIKIFS